jgi:peroxiredoxin
MKTKSISLFATAIIFAASCQMNHQKEEKTSVTEQNEQVTTMKEMTHEKGTLDSLLNEKRVAFSNTASEEKKKVYAEGLEAVKNSGILDKALNIGDKAPNFILNNALNKPVALYDELKKSPVILTWYRGGWCPYCNITLQYFQERLPDFQKAGAILIALTPELPDKSLTTTEKHKLQFLVLSDVKNKIGKEYGVVFQLTPEVASIYQEAFNLHQYNGDESNELPLAATYVIDQDGVIQFAFLDFDYRNRAEPDEIIAALAAIKAKK